MNGASLKGLVVHKQGWGEVQHLLQKKHDKVYYYMGSVTLRKSVVGKHSLFMFTFHMMFQLSGIPIVYLQ